MYVLYKYQLPSFYYDLRPGDTLELSNSIDPKYKYFINNFSSTKLWDTDLNESLVIITDINFSANIIVFDIIKSKNNKLCKRFAILWNENRRTWVDFYSFVK